MDNWQDRHKIALTAINFIKLTEIIEECKENMRLEEEQSEEIEEQIRQLEEERTRLIENTVYHKLNDKGNKETDEMWAQFELICNLDKIYKEKYEIKQIEN